MFGNFSLIVLLGALVETAHAAFSCPGGREVSTGVGMAGFRYLQEIHWAAAEANTVSSTVQIAGR